MLKLEIYTKSGNYYLNDQRIDYINHYISLNHDYIMVEGIEIIPHYANRVFLDEILKEFPEATYNPEDIKIKKTFWFFGKSTKILDGFCYTKGKRFIRESNQWEIIYYG